MRAGVAIALVTAVGVANAQSTPEENRSGAVYRINAPSIYARGVTGKNVTAAIIDTGLLVTHREFKGRVLTGYNAFNGSTNVADGHGHGTHVAGIVGAGRNNSSTSGMFGAAYEAYLLPIKALDDRGYGSYTAIANGIQYAVNQRNSASVPVALKPFVINLSLGSASPSATVEPALRNAVNAGMVVAAAAGNSGEANPIYPARYAKETWANGQIIAVGAVDANNVIATWSNRAGDTKDFYLVAPGVNIYSTYVTTKRRRYVESYATMSGTSMATPYVTGAAALIKSGWSYLSARQIASILFVSASDLGAPGTDEVYGRGMLNLEAALQPIGELSAPTSSGTKIAVNGTTLTASAAAGSALQAAGRAGLLQVGSFDAYGRDYQVDLAPTVRRAPHTANGLAPILAAVDAAAAHTYSRHGTTLRVASRSEATRLALGQAAVDWSDGSAMSGFDAAGREFTLGFSGMGTHAFGLAGELARRGDAHLSGTLANPYFSLVPQHLHAGMGIPLSGVLRMKWGVLMSDPRPGISDPGMRHPSARGQSMTLAEVSSELDWAVWSFGVGRLQESDSVLGSAQSGALNLAGSADTNVVNFGVAFSPAPRLKVGSQYTVGYTGAVTNRADSLLTGYSAGRSDSYAVFAALREPFTTGDSLSVTISQPLRTVSGAMQLVVPVGADENGAPRMASRSISLRPEGRETRADALYISPVNRHANWFLGVGVRHHPDHDPSAPTEMAVGAGVRTSF